jgi:hypothetical protein
MEASLKVKFLIFFLINLLKLINNLPKPIFTCFAPFLFELRSVLTAELLAELLALTLLLLLLEGLDDLEDPAFELPLCIGMLALYFSKIILKYK